MRVFLDTNVLVSAFATRGLSADVLRVVLVEHELVVSERVLEERDVLGRKIGLPESTIDAVERLLRQHPVQRDPSELPDLPLADPADLAILGSAAAAAVDVFVTGDGEILDLETAGSFVITSPRGFWRMLREAG